MYEPIWPKRTVYICMYVVYDAQPGKMKAHILSLKQPPEDLSRAPHLAKILLRAGRASKPRTKIGSFWRWGSPKSR